MAAKRPIDNAVTNFYKAMGAVFALFMALWAFIAVHQYDEGLGAPYFNVAFTASSVVAVLGTVAFLEYARRRPVGAYHTWGEAMLAAAAVFFLLFWVYGVVPHQWLVYADSELGWRKDRLIEGYHVGGQGIIAWALPFDLPYLVLRDVVAVLIYGVGLAGNVAGWMVWQNRGKTAPVEVEKSEYGRPIVKKGVTV
ncbi:hypothetical protein [Candidatus Poriferisocius sp.]|uniref:hypothetical protein n=1 Tax=Candidatus Poriferisocius sp. TaxID=3101276 RepID=UPI003B022D04